MPQDVSSYSASPHSTTVDAENPGSASWWSQESEAEALTEAGGFPVESYADSLMDDLFEEVDQILERGAKLPTEAAKPEFVSLQPLSIPRLSFPPILMPRSAIVAEPEDADLAALVTTATDPETPQTTGTSIDRLLLLTACASMVATGLLWWFVFRGQEPQPVATVPAPTTEQLKTQEDAQFLDYVQRSLEAIDRRSAANQLANGTSTTASANNLPNVSVPDNPTTAASGTPTVLERVYIPVYQPPQALYPLPGQVPTNQIPATVATAPVTTAPAAPPAAPVAATPLSSAPNIAASAATHVLVGVMQLGDRSAALFEINGIPQRVYIGESIGTSGWMLVSVSNQEAIVRRNGEVRSIYVGQQF